MDDILLSNKRKSWREDKPLNKAGSILDIWFECNHSVCREDKDKIYAIAPNGYYWGLKKIYSAGYQYVLERFDK